MKPLLKIALLLALAIEAVNLWLLAPPIDVGYSPGTPWYVNLIGAQWVILHYPALLLLDPLERLAGCCANNVPGGCGHVDFFVFFVSGYLTTALLLVVLILVFRSIRRSDSRNLPRKI